VLRCVRPGRSRRTASRPVLNRLASLSRDIGGLDIDVDLKFSPNTKTGARVACSDLKPVVGKDAAALAN
jgi:hypothetical protein